MQALASSPSLVPTSLSRLARRVLEKRLLVLCAAAIALPLASRPAAAQSLINGGVVSGAISPVGDVDTYIFTASAGEGFQIQMADVDGTSFYPLLRLYSPSGALLLTTSGTSVASIAQTAAASGTYRVLASDYPTTGTGNYDIHFVRAPGANEGGALVNGDLVSGTIGLGDLDSFTFPANAGESFQIQLAEANGTSLYPLLTLYDPSGALLISTSGSSVASIAQAAATTGTYTLVASDYPTINAGDYDLHFTLRPGANEGGELPSGGVVSGTIDLGDLDSYTFPASAGESFLVQLAEANGTSLYPLLSLYDPSGMLLISTSGSSVAKIAMTAATSGTYTVVASDYSTINTGDYDLHFVRAPGANEGGALVNGDVVSGTIDLGDLDSFTFVALAGQDFQLQLAEANGNSLYPLLTLYDPFGALLISTSGSSIASIAMTAATTGTYTVVASDYPTTNAGDYGLFFSRGVETYCTAGTTAIGCTSQMSALGDPSVSAPSGFLVRASGGEGNKVGIFFFGTSGRQAIQWGNGTSFLCVIPPIERTPAANGGGTEGFCNAAASFDFNELITLDPGAAPTVGSLVQVQYWFRDPANPSNQTSSLSNALEFTLQP